MARLFVTSINLNQNELQNAVIQNLLSAPSSPVAGQVYFNGTSGNKTLYFYNGTDWIPASGSTEVIQDVIGSALIGGTALTATYNDTSGETTINLDNTAVTHGSYGSSAAKTVSFTVDQQGRLTAASEQDIQIATSQVTGLQEYIEDSVNTVVVAGEGIDVSYNDAGNAYTVSAEDASDTNKGIASFSSTDFTVTNGNVTINSESISDIVGGMVTGNTETGITVTYQDTDNTLDFAVADQFPSHTTSDLAEGTNLYYTAERVQDEISTAIVAGTGLDSTYNDGAGTLTIDIDSTVTTNSGSQTLTNKTLGASTALGANLDAATYKITNLGAPTNSTDAATKAYVDAVSEGLHVHEAADVYVASNVTIATALEAGDTVDNITLTAGMRILVNGQTTKSQNGIYVVQSSGGPTRALDFDTALEVASGDFIFVSSGDLYANTGWVQTKSPATIGTDEISFTQFSGAGTYTAGSGLTLTGTVFSVDTTPSSGFAGLEVAANALNVKVNTADGLEVTSDGLGINNGAGLTFSSGALVLDTANGYGVRKYAVSVGDGSATSYTVTHNLGTKDLAVHVYDNSSPYAQVETDVEHAGNNTVTIKFATAPTSNQYRVVVVG
jgi:hypothetical protein